MTYLLFKYFLTAGIIALVSEVAKRSDRLGALLVALPLVTLLSVIWIYRETGNVTKISNHLFYTFWYVLPTLPMLIAMPKLLSIWGFWIALGGYIVGTVVIFLLFALVIKRFGIHLL